MAVEDCRYYQGGVDKFGSNKGLHEVECDNPVCELTIGLIKKKVQRRSATGVPLMGTPHPIEGRARCVEVGILKNKVERLLQKKNIDLASEEVKARLINERDLLKKEAEDLGIM